MSLDEVFDLLDVDESFKPEIIEILKKKRNNIILKNRSIYNSVYHWIFFCYNRCVVDLEIGE